MNKGESILTRYHLAKREHNPAGTSIRLGDVVIGEGHFAIIAGPCAIESEEQIFEMAQLVADCGIKILRGGAFKPRTSPYDFQGLGLEGLRFLQKAAKAFNLYTISEVMDAQDIEAVASHVDILQIGARNMQNFSLLKQVAKIQKPILLKRGFAATYEDFLLSAEYILAAGNPQVILCERGIRTFETYSRNTLDLAAVPILKDLSHLPVIVDPSHALGIRHLVPTMAQAAVVVRAHGMMIEVHPYPDKAWCDAKQSLTPNMFKQMIEEVKLLEKFCVNNLWKELF